MDLPEITIELVRNSTKEELAALARRIVALWTAEDEEEKPIVNDPSLDADRARVRARFPGTHSHHDEEVWMYWNTPRLFATVHTGLGLELWKLNYFVQLADKSYAVFAAMKP